MLENKSSTRLLAIDGVRGLGCLYIFFFHSLAYHNLRPTFFKIASAGEILMFSFFVFSGFLVFNSTKKLIQKHSKWRLKFLILRFFRIVPLWWLVLFLYFIYPGLKFDQLVLNATFLFGFVNYNTYFVPIVPAWSLFVEESFYLLLPMIWIFLSSLKRTIIVYCFY